MFHFDDFATVGILANASASGMPYSYADAGVTIQGKAGNPDVANELGVLQWDGMDADQDLGGIQGGYGHQIAIPHTLTNAGVVAFECRLRKTTIADNAVGFFVGLAEGPVGDAHLVVDTGVIKAGISAVGFSCLMDDGDKADIIHQDTVAAAPVTVLANAATLVANTYIKLGFLFDPAATTDKRIKWFVDGTELGTYTTGTQIAASTFPGDEGMAAMVIAAVGGAGLTDTLSLDWWAYGMKQPD